MVNPNRFKIMPLEGLGPIFGIKYINYNEDSKIGFSLGVDGLPLLVFNFIDPNVGLYYNNFYIDSGVTYLQKFLWEPGLDYEGLSLEAGYNIYQK